ncbi:2'-5' RNA ligase family protein [Paractinoplanes maris]|uniref:2'-5' RNA ligase family protein n=1 Tax=Paractinoplanes maris TaxID=1734446 RepID=UPI0020204CFE|nr:2'-5' RNA ligase family protein [Actinoplanes maris]
MHTVELLPTDEVSARVRALWDRLAAAGLPSLATHQHPTNRPHLTLVTAESLTGLPPLGLPLEFTLTEVRMLGRALVWAVMPSSSLRALHSAVWSSIGGWPPSPEFEPHLSLALRMPEQSRPAALDLLATTPPLSGTFIAARTYDTDHRTVRDL